MKTVLACFFWLAGCGGDGESTDADADTDSDTDTATDTGSTSESDSESESESESETVSETDTGPEPDHCADAAELPAPSDAGASCIVDRDCELGFFCVPDTNGWPEGYCLAGGPVDSGACIPDDPEHPCPQGSTCAYAGNNGLGVPVYYCFRSCVISDANPWDGSSCGCREGYQCHLTSNLCWPGCMPETQDVDCCRYWADTDGDWLDDGPGEDRDVPGCTEECDPEAFRCVHPGDDGAEFGDGCTLDQDCPANADCIRERDADGIAGGDHAFQDGYCLRQGCQLPGRECDGQCRRVPGVTSYRLRQDEGTWACVDTCKVAPEGADPYVHHTECRDGYGCHPLVEAKDEAEDGYCWNGEVLTADRVNNAGAACVWDFDCYSPLGQGVCIEDGGGAGDWTDGVCAIQACDFAGMDVYCPSAEDKICEPQDAGELSLCVERCDDPGGGSGPLHGCSRDDYACYPSALGDGSGVCYPACTITAFCRDFFGIEGANLCDIATGLCRI